MKGYTNGKKQATLSRFFTLNKSKPPPIQSEPKNSSECVKKLQHLKNSSPDKNDTVNVPQKRGVVGRASNLPPKKRAGINSGSLEPSPIKMDNEPDVLSHPTKLARVSTIGSKSGETKARRLKLTPLEQQFKDLKTDHPDKVLAIQVGYKFKFFGQDAVIASHLLNIMLIPGNIELDESNHDRFAYCLIPDNRLHVHLQRLLNNGLKVGVVKQTETAVVKSVEGQSKSGLFERKITAVYTQATYMGDELFTGDPTINRSNNSNYVANSSYILCIDELNFPKETAMVAVQPVTGSIVHDTFSDSTTRDQLESRLIYLNPSEVIVIGVGNSPLRETKMVLKLQNPNVSIQFVQRKAIETIHADLMDFFLEFNPTGELKSLAEYYTLNYPPAVQSCVDELIQYLHEFKLSSVFTIPDNFVSLTDSKKFMLLPANTLKALDIFQVQDEPTSKRGTLFWLLNHTHTRKGLDLLRSWISKPLTQREDIEDRIKAVLTLREGEFVHLLDAFKKSLANLGRSGLDLDRTLIKVHYSATYQSDKISRKDFYLMLKSFAEFLQLFKDFGDKALSEFNLKLPNNKLLHKILESMLNSSKLDLVSGFLRQINASEALDDKDLSKQKIGFFDVERFPDNFVDIQNELNEIKTIDLLLSEELSEIRLFLKRPQLSYVTVLKDTHLIEVRNGQAVNSLPDDWMKIGATKSVSRFRPPNVASLHRKRLYHSEKLLSVCDESFNRFILQFDSHYPYFKSIVQNLANFDCLLSLAKASVSDTSATYVSPTFVDEQILEIENASHPILLRLNAQNLYVSNSVNLSYDKGRVLIITGPNMGGKSSYVKQIALLVIMAQIGCPIPSTKATMGIFDSVFVRMGASDDILKGKSTFMVEMSESATIIQEYTLKSLVILDEIGRGTGTIDGISLAHSILRYIIEDKAGPLTLFITHYPSLHVLEKEYLMVKNYHMAFIEMARTGNDDSKWPEVIFLYKLVKGVVSNLYGLNVANMAGINRSIIAKAHEVSERMKSRFENQADYQWFSQLDHSCVSHLLNSI